MEKYATAIAPKKNINITINRIAATISFKQEDNAATITGAIAAIINKLNYPKN